MGGEKGLTQYREGSYHAYKNLPPIHSLQNAESALIFGTSVTDTIADWISSGYVSGPFDHPPLCEFRSNALMAVVQPSKIRPVMNLSSPKLLSLNDAVNELLLPKLSMSTAKEFSYSLLDAGLFANMWKLDLKDAYKNIGTSLYVEIAWFSVAGKVFCRYNNYFLI